MISDNPYDLSNRNDCLKNNKPVKPVKAKFSPHDLSNNPLKKRVVDNSPYDLNNMKMEKLSD